MEKELDSKTDKKVRSFMFARMTVTFGLHRILCERCKKVGKMNKNDPYKETQ